MDRRYVYLLKRTKKNRAKIVDYRKVWDATKAERRLHRIFESQRFEMRKTKAPPWIGYHVKIGIAKDPEERLEEINKSGLKSGRTEWFYFMPGDLFYVSCLLIYWVALPFIRIIIFIALTAFIFIQYQNL
jgi:hypothetical protein